jgi:hypothetical protein
MKSDINKLIQILNKRDLNGVGINDKSGDPKPKDIPIVPLTNEQKIIGNAIRYQMYQNTKSDSAYNLSEYAKNLKIDPTLTCIGGACDMYKNLGLDFSQVGDEASGVRESGLGGGKVVEYNPTFAKNYSKAGFEKLLGREMSSEDLQNIINNGNLAPGDLIQYIDEKGVPVHTNVVYKVNKDGTYTVYNSYAHNSNKNTGQNMEFIYNINPVQNSGKKVRHNVYRLSPDAAANLVQSGWGQGGKVFEPHAKMGNIDNYEKTKQEFIDYVKQNWNTYKPIFKVNRVEDIPDDVIKSNVIHQMTEDYEEKSNPKYWIKEYPGITSSQAVGFANNWSKAIERVKSLEDDFGVPIEQRAKEAYKKKAGATPKNNP